MRFDIRSMDRMGITQEILKVFTRQNWNLISVEMHLHHTFVQLDHQVNSAELMKGLQGIDGIIEVVEVDLLPGERRAQHLDAVLSTLQDPILDIDSTGRILLANSAATTLLGRAKDELQGLSLTDFIDCPLQSLLSEYSTSIDISCAGQSFLAQVTPFFSYNGDRKSVTGAVILLQSLRRLGQQISAVNHSGSESSQSLIGSSIATQKLLAITQRFSNIDMPVLIQGETGTGKELIAHILHDSGVRAGAPFMAINCAAVPENLLESELFGYAPGAFSSASKSGKPGLFELADGGSIFLDEIGEMSAYLQAKLLRFLQDFSFRRIGGAKEITVNVRIISATHRDLQSMMEKKIFREDLYYRLNVLNLQVPPLRQRRADIPALTRHFITRAAEQTRRQAPQISAAALDKLMAHHWPGNIRELQNVLFRTVAMSDGDMLEHWHLSTELAPAETSATADMAQQFARVENWHSALGHFEKELLSTLYPLYPSSRKLAQRLQVSHNTIALKLKKHGIGIDSQATDSPVNK
ncbi:MAG: sigma 54-interacting transcriptional regulator [Pseudomonadales bacterium]|nr:sigma 54-interacting transcriptional regulator [Pseudomonadales bacterium]